MKQTLTISLLLALLASASAQYGYDTGLQRTQLQELSLKDDLADGLLDHDGYTNLQVAGWRPTYYIRQAVRHEAGVNPALTVASVVNGQTSTGGSRIIHGVGVRSDGGRWKTIGSMTTDPWRNRFINASQQVWVVDLVSEGITAAGGLYGGWPRTTKVVDSDMDTPDENDNMGQQEFQYESSIDAFAPLWLRSDAVVKPWVVTLDSKADNLPVGVNVRNYNQRLNYARDLVPDTDRGFSWLRCTPNSVPVAHFFLYPGGNAALNRTRFAWEVSGQRPAVRSADFKDLRAVLYPRSEYYAINAGIVGGPEPTGEEISNGEEKFWLDGNIFPWFKTGGPIGTPEETTSWNKHQRFALLNAPEYVRNPGDMVISYDRKRIYFIPFSQNNIGTGDMGSNAQVLNVSLPAASSFEGDVPKATYSAPLIISGKPGFRMNNVEFSTCAGEGLRVEEASVASGNSHDMYFSQCKFINTGVAGLFVRRTGATKIIGCSFSGNDGRSLAYWENSRPLVEATTYARYQFQNNAENVVAECSFGQNGFLHPSVPNVALYHKPAQFWLKGNTFFANSGISIHFGGTKVYVWDNLFNKCGSDVAEVGVVYTGRSLSNLGCDIVDNSFTDCTKGLEWGLNTTSPFDQRLGCVMLDDASSGVMIRKNDFSSSENLLTSTENIPLVINGGLFNYIWHNKFPNNQDVAFYGAQTIRNIEVKTEGSLSVFTAPGWDQIGADFLPIPDPVSGPAVSWQFNATPWTSAYTNADPFYNPSGSNYYGAEWMVSGGNVPYTWITDAQGNRKIRLLAPYWHVNTTIRDKWFKEDTNNPGKWLLNFRGNRVIFDPAASGNSNLATRISGNINDTFFPNAVQFITTGPAGLYLQPPAPTY